MSLIIFGVLDRQTRQSLPNCHVPLNSEKGELRQNDFPHQLDARIHRSLPILSENEIVPRR